MNVKTAVSEMTRQQFEEVFGDSLKLNESMARYTSARVGGKAEMFLSVNTVTDLRRAVELAYAQRIPYIVIGGGSNILVSDEGVSGLVVLNRARNVRYRHNGIHVVCAVESGMNLSSLSRQCIAKGLAGLEWAIGIPGSLGGAVFGNAGAHGGDMSGVVLDVTVWEPGSGIRVYSNEEMQYEYRSSALKRDQQKARTRRVVLSAELQLTPESVDVLNARADAFTAHRKQTQPGGASMGSMFKNPENYYAGYLIESAGLKGLSVGNARISDKHANFFVCDGEASAEDVRELIAEAWNAVRQQFNVEMELEVELVGNWDFKD